MPSDLVYCFALFLLLFLSSLGYGLWVLSWLKLSPNDTPMYIIYAAGLGYGATAYLIFFFGIIQVLHQGLAYVVLIGGLLALLHRRAACVGGLAHLTKNMAGLFATPWSIYRIAWLSFIVAFTLLNLSLALTPAISQDALIYHLVSPKIFIQNHGIEFISGNFYTNFPHTIEMLFTLGMLLKGPILAKLIHFSFGLLTAVAVFHWTADNSSVSTGLLAAAVYYTLPLVAKLSGWAYVDLALAFFTFAMITALLDWKERQHSGFIVLAGILGGLAMGTKYSGIIVLLTVVLSALLFLNNEKGSTDSSMGVMALKVFIIATVVASPWYLKNAIFTGNAVYPFLHSLFGGRGWSHEMENLYAIFLSNIGSRPGIIDYFRIPWDVCLLGGKGKADFDGYIGPIFLLVPILLVAIRPKLAEIRFMLFFSAVYFVIWGAVIQQLRFLVPIFPALCVALGLLIHKSPEAWRRTRPFILLFCLFTMGINAYIHVDRFMCLAPYKYVIGIQSEKDFLRSHLCSYTAIEYINDHLTARDKVLFVFLRDGPYYCDRPYAYDPVFEANTFMDAIKAGKSAAGALAHLRQKGITHVLLNHNYVPSIGFILEPKQREKFAGVLGLLSLQAGFQNYSLFEVNSQASHFR
ncbi:MAG: glycosyltransferase family 39 protein [Deltaproteobacteria bacterium]|nr:glycosyltransferase family 39 protein [Deltaproteobacteria bacterium]